MSFLVFSPSPFYTLDTGCCRSQVRRKENHIMQLNPDCIRDILITMEKQPFNHPVNFDDMLPLLEIIMIQMW